MRTCLFAITSVCLLSGCGGKPEFSHRAEYEELQPYAQEYVDRVLTSYFGTPTEMVVWDRLPLNANVATATVAAASERDIRLELSEPHGEVDAGIELLWPVDESGKTASAWVREWHQTEHTAILDEKLTTPPAAGTSVIVGPGHVLTRGRALYAEHCQHCHGVTGDGAGPTAKYLNPRPRDYRKGIFKFTLTQSAERASRVDLSRIIEDGIPGTYMPSFKLLKPEEMRSLVEYVLWLSMRGEVEYQLVRYLSEGYSNKAVKDRLKAAEEKKKSDLQAARESGEKPEKREYESRSSIRREFEELVNDPEEIPAVFNETIDLLASRWTTAQEPAALVVPTENFVPADMTPEQLAEHTRESIARGRKLYLSADLNCVACHGEAGYGDGPQTYTITKNLETGEENPEPGLYDHWGNAIAPRNLHTGIFRGGRRPLDLYCRLHAGIKGTPMPAFGAKLKDQQLWDLVNYIYSVPYEKEVAGSGEPPAAPAADAGVASN